MMLVPIITNIAATTSISNVVCTGSLAVGLVCPYDTNTINLSITGTGFDGIGTTANVLAISTGVAPSSLATVPGNCGVATVGTTSTISGTQVVCTLTVTAIGSNVFTAVYSNNGGVSAPVAAIAMKISNHPHAPTYLHTNLISFCLIA